MSSHGRHRAPQPVLDGLTQLLFEFASAVVYVAGAMLGLALAVSLVDYLTR